jgi:hypothetical protein
MKELKIELLKLLLARVQKNFTSFKWMFNNYSNHPGMCSQMNDLYAEKAISHAEKFLLFTILKDYRPKGQVMHKLWWANNRKGPRVRWIKSTIKKIQNEQ